MAEDPPKGTLIQDAVTPAVIQQLAAITNTAKRFESPPEPDRYIMTAKTVVVENYNAHRDSSRSPELGVDSVYVVWFSKTLGNWKAMVASPIVRGLYWEVTYNGHRNEVYLDVYKKLNNVKISLGVDKT